MSALPPGPSSAGRELNQLFLSAPFQFLKDCYEKYGDIFTLELGDWGISQFQASGKWVFLANAEYLKILFKTDDSVMLGGRANQIQFQQSLPLDGSIMLDGAPHLERRKILGKLMQSKKSIQTFTDALNHIIEDEISAFPHDQPFRLTESVNRISAQAVRVLTFGPENTQEISALSVKAGKFGDSGMTRIQKQAVLAACHEEIEPLLASCPYSSSKDDNDNANGSDDNNVHAILMKAWKTDQVLKRNEVEAELLVMLVAGADTTASTMSWVMAQILGNPPVHEKTMEELNRVFAGEKPTAEKLDQLRYLDAVIHEACRLSPLLLNSAARFLIQPLQLGDYCLPQGTMVLSCMHLIHTRADYYPEPLVFKPERFFGIHPDPYKHVFFGGGIRRCLGMTFALHLIKLTVAVMLYRCKFDPIQAIAGTEVNRSFLVPKGGVLVNLKDTHSA